MMMRVALAAAALEHVARTAWPSASAISAVIGSTFGAPAHAVGAEELSLAHRPSSPAPSSAGSDARSAAATGVRSDSTCTVTLTVRWLSAQT